MRHLLLPLIVLLLAAPASRRVPFTEVWYGPRQQFGHLGHPQPFVNVLGTVYAPEGVDSLMVTYSVNRGPRRPLHLGPDLHRLARPGDFNADISVADLRDGSNRVEIEAVDADGARSVEVVNVRYTAGNVWPLPYAIDFAGVTAVQDVVQVIDGHWVLDEGGVRPTHRYYDRVLGVGDVSWTNYEVTVEATIHAFTPPRPGPPTYNVSHFGITARWQGHHEDEHQPSRRWYPLGAANEFTLSTDLQDCRWRILGGGGDGAFFARQETGRAIELGQRYIFKMRVETVDGPATRYRLKMWPAAAAEPEAWDLDGRDDGADYNSGSVLFVAHHTDVTIWRFNVVPVQPEAE